MLGPLEYIVIGFAGNRFDGSIAREVERVVENGTIRLIDIVFVGKDADGNTVILELDNKDDPRFAPFATLLGDRMALLTPEDLEHVASELPPDTSGMVMLFEHRWAEHIKEAMAAAGGFLVGRSVIPPEVLEAIGDELDGHMAAVAARSA
jgi:Family of unknown function (DUF6325)